jgi:hypothetical protein
MPTISQTIGLSVMLLVCSIGVGVVVLHPAESIRVSASVVIVIAFFIDVYPLSNVVNLFFNSLRVLLALMD